MKWGTKFDSGYVNRLFKMVKANMTVPYRFVCFTDDGNGIDPNVEIFSIPPMLLDNNAPERGWRKLTIFKRKLFNLQGQALFLDLDIAIRANIDDFFNVEGDFLIIKDWDFPNDIIGNSSVFRFSIGSHSYVLENFIKNSDAVKSNFRNEQAYLSHIIKERGNLKYWDKNWCVSFKRHCLNKWPICYFKEPMEPLNAKIVVFHGRPNPQEACKGYVGKYGFRYVKPTTWLKKYVGS
jgi:hypothetical protein